MRKARVEWARKNQKNKWHLMHNPLLLASPGSSPSPRSTPASSRASSPPLGSADGKCHPLTKLAHIADYKGGKQQKCQMCNKKTIWCCSDCSDVAHGVVPLCPPMTNCRGKIVRYPCHDQHRLRPNWYPRGKQARNFGGPKRRRTAADIDGQEPDGACSGDEMECESCE